MQHTMDFGLIISIFIHVRFIVKKLNLIEISLGQIGNGSKGVDDDFFTAHI